MSSRSDERYFPVELSRGAASGDRWTGSHSAEGSILSMQELRLSVDPKKLNPHNESSEYENIPTTSQPLSSTTVITRTAQCGIHLQSRYGDLQFMDWLFQREQSGAQFVDSGSRNVYNNLFHQLPGRTMILFRQSELVAIGKSSASHRFVNVNRIGETVVVNENIT